MRYLLVLVMASMVAVAVAAQTGAVSLTLTTSPDPLGLGQNRFDVSVRDAGGRPVTDAQVALLLVMPADPATKHPEMRTEGMLNNVGGGRYNGIAMVTMAGRWDVTATATRDGRTLGRTTVALVAHATRPRPAAAPAAAQHGAHTHTHADAAAVKNPVPATPESVAGGEALFKRHCVACHGAGGRGDGPASATLKMPPADLTDAEWKHGPTDGEIFAVVRDGAKNAGMKAYRGVLTDRQIWDVVNYIRSLGVRR